MIAVVIINWNSGSLLRPCVQSVLDTARDAEVVVIDNASTDASLESLAALRNQIDVVQNSGNRGFAAAVNQGFDQTSTPFVLILNPDLRVLPGAIELLAEFLSAHPKAGAVGGYLNDDYLPRPFPTAASLARENLGLERRLYSKRWTGPVAVEQPAAAALMVRRDAYEQIDGFDERFYPAWYEDVDFCSRMKTAGWQIYFEPAAEFQHEGGYSAQALGPKAFAQAYYRNQLRYAQKHFGPASRFTVRVSIAAGMLLRMAARPGLAGAYASVLRGVLGGW